MKRQILSLVAVMAFGMGASATNLDGRWELTNRECLSGNAVDDAFELGRDSLELRISKSTYVLSQTIDGEFSLVEGQVEVNDTYLIFDDFDDTTPSYEVAYDFYADVLVIYSEGFEEGGSCPIGDTLATTLKMAQ